jgi:hypothetical protein
MSNLLDVGNEERAAQICDKLHGIFAELEDLIGLVDREVDSEQKATAFRRALGSICGAITLDALAPLYRKYPALKPGTWPQDL